MRKMKKIIVFVVSFFLLLPHIGSATGINIGRPNAPLRKVICNNEKRAIEEKLANIGRFDIEVVEAIIPAYAFGNEPFPGCTKLSLGIRNMETNQTAPFKKGTKIWFEMLQSAGGGNDDWKEIPNSDWVMGYSEENSYVLSEERLGVIFKGAEIVEKAGIKNEDLSYCLAIHVE